MIDRIVLVKLKADRGGESLADVARHSEAALAAVPGVESASVRVGADDRSAKDWDLLFHVRFADMDAVSAYVSHPLHREYVDGYLEPRMEVIKAWNFRPPA